MPARPKAELYDVVDRIVYMYEKEKMSQRDISALLKSEGIDISKTAVYRTLKNNRELAAQYRKTINEAQVLIDAVKDGTNTDVLETASTLLVTHLFNYAKSIETIEFEDPSQFSEVFSRIARAHTALAKTRLEYAKGFQAAKDAIITEISAQLQKDHPDILDTIVAIIGNIKDEKISQSVGKSARH